MHSENRGEKRGKRRKREDTHTRNYPHTLDTCFYNNLLYNYDKHHSQSKYNNQNLCLVKTTYVSFLGNQNIKKWNKLLLKSLK